MLYAVIFWLCLFCNFSFAGEENTYQQEGEKFAKDLLTKIDLKKLKAPDGKGVKGEGCTGCKANLENPQNLVANIKSEMKNVANETILVFVSFSMPNIALQELLKQADKYNAKLVLRGLHKNSFKETMQKILEIDKNGVQFDINPELFKAYKVKQVPTFVLVKSDKEINRLSGNVSLEFANEELAKS